MPDPIPISTLDDPRVDLFRDVRDKDLRGHDRLFMAESEMVLRRLLRQPDRLHAVLVTPARLEAMGDALDALPDTVPLYVAEMDVMTQIAGFHIHRGVLAAGRRPQPCELTLDVVLGPMADRSRLTLLVAEGLTNVDNMGGLFRNAAALGADAIILDPSCCDPLYRKAVRVSMGHVLSVPWAVCTPWPDGLDRLKSEWGVTLVGAEVDDDAVPLWEVPAVARMALLFGSEGHGLSREALARCDVVCEIPMEASVPSVNVATAAAVFLYERRRREGGPGVA